MQARSGVLSITLAASLCTVAFADDSYRVPPQEAVDILDIAPPPAASVSPDGRWMVVTSLQAMPTIADRAAPMAALGGVRVNVKTNGPYDTPRYDDHSSYTGTGTSYRLIDLRGGGKKELAVPTEKLGPPLWSPDGSRFAFLHTMASGIQLWVAEASSGTALAITT